MDGILLQKCLTVSDKRIYKDVRLSCIRTTCERACKTRDERAKEAESGCDSECYVACLHKLLLLVFLLHNPVQDVETEHRESHLENYQGHRHCPELAVHRCIVEPELCKPHKMISPGQKDSDYGSSHKPPFLASFAKDESQDEKEYGDGSHIHRSGCERLRTPVQRHMLECLAEVWLPGSLQELSCLGIHCKFSGRRTSVEVRNQQVRHLADTI